MRINFAALAVCLAFFALLLFAVSKGSTAVPVAEVVATVLIAIGIGGFAFRGQRSR